jgi:RND family efflux transporter MFP subunit
MRVKKKYIIGLGALFGLFFLWRVIVLIFAGGGSSGRPGRPPVAVEVDSVLYAPIADVRKLTGTVFPQYQYVVAPKISGRVLALHKRIGDSVKTGEPIGRIDDAEYQQAVLEAEASLKIARASLLEAEIQFELARQDKERVEALQAKGIASPAELDAAVSSYSAQESRLDLARAQIEQREASLASAKIRLGYTRLTASKPGLIGERFVDEGALLAPNSPVVTVVGIDSVIVRATVVERDYGYIRAGQPADVMVDAFPSRRFAGVVARIAPLLEKTARVAQTEVEIQNDSLLLKPGMFARVQVVTGQRDRAQTIPRRALVTRNGDTGVFMVGSDATVAHYVPVTTGIVTPDRVEILSPTLGGLVVTLGQHLLTDGSPVLLPKSLEDAATSAGDATRRAPPQ